MKKELIGKSILDVEDGPKIRRLVKIYLMNKGYEELEADNGIVAQEMIEKYDPCILILDLMLPGKSGEEICRLVHNDLGSMMPVITLTAKASEKGRIDGFKLGATRNPKDANRIEQKIFNVSVVQTDTVVNGNQAEKLAGLVLKNCGMIQSVIGDVDVRYQLEFTPDQPKKGDVA